MDRIEVHTGGSKRHSRARPKCWAVLLGLSLLLLAPACGGGSDDGGVTPDTGCLVYEPSSTPTSGNVAGRTGVGSTCNVLELELIVTDVANIFTVEFTLQYSESTVRYAGVNTALSILESDGTQVATIVNESPGEAQISITRLGGAQGGIDAIGQQTLAKVLLSRAGTVGAIGSLVFTETKFFDGDRNEIPGIGWSGGQVFVR
jgi:hypothetical protein